MIEVPVAQILSEPVTTIAPSATVTAAARTMRTENINSIVVVDGTEPTGILTSTDVVEVAAEDRQPSAVTVGERMTGTVVTTTPDATVHEAAEQMRSSDIGHLPVVDDEGALAGIVTATDLTMYVSGATDLVGSDGLP